MQNIKKIIMQQESTTKENSAKESKQKEKGNLEKANLEKKESSAKLGKDTSSFSHRTNTSSSTVAQNSILERNMAKDSKVLMVNGHKRMLTGSRMETRGNQDNNKINRKEKIRTRPVEHQTREQQNEH